MPTLPSSPVFIGWKQSASSRSSSLLQIFIWFFRLRTSKVDSPFRQSWKAQYCYHSHHCTRAFRCFTFSHCLFYRDGILVAKPSSFKHRCTVHSKNRLKFKSVVIFAALSRFSSNTNVFTSRTLRLERRFSRPDRFISSNLAYSSKLVSVLRTQHL